MKLFLFVWRIKKKYFWNFKKKFPVEPEASNATCVNIEKSPKHAESFLGKVSLSNKYQ